MGRGRRVHGRVTSQQAVKITVIDHADHVGLGNCMNCRQAVNFGRTIDSRAKILSHAPTKYPLNHQISVRIVSNPFEVFEP